ncbi:retron Ec78 anti-phage system effector ATPase PtuA [Pseudomonas anguilliseptica]|uniref:retron Ec78 anti-phage system effector ATPase PtuA n=1 Tax=Pseudomonas anguilliseptica TaxID=53406 RepID=UPI001F18F257|nr:retron Ec78 anti-phage system effector ATPase PtuA [Pseudomonas anguilliseptica]MCE5364133.1 AAA family ATPase [Pseudomonas anguilliseptica]
MNEQHSGHKKTIKVLAQKAESGILKAQNQLHEYFEKGKYVTKDAELEKKYFAMLENTLSGKKIHLKSLEISGFRRFQNLEIDFNEKLTVIIGNNGAGKTSIADAISKIFSWFNNNLEKDSTNAKHIMPTDISIKNAGYAEIAGKFQFDKANLFDFSLSRTVSGFVGSISSEVSIIKQLGAMYRKTAHNPNISIPLLAFYSVERSWLTLKNEISEKASSDITTNRFSAVKDATDGSGRLDNFSELYIELANMAEGEELKEAKDIKAQIATLEELIHDEINTEQHSTESPLLRKLNSKKEELENMRNSAPTTRYKEHLQSVNQAIETLMPDVKNLRVERRTGKVQLLVTNFDNEINIAQLSQGQKVLVALAGDLARRLVILNPESKKPLDGHGIVVIDEIELHLHPKWQQEILGRLQRTFPNIQFIVTTHSPQVLSTVRRENIRTLELNSVGQIIAAKPLAATYGEPSGDVLQSVMLVDPQPPIAEKSDLQRLTELVDQGFYDRPEAVELMQRLLTVLSEQHPQLLRLQRSIRRQKALKE